jgi:hypothetical protein
MWFSEVLGPQLARRDHVPAFMYKIEQKITCGFAGDFLLVLMEGQND